MENFCSDKINFFGDMKNNIFYINLSLIKYCNYQCSYCCAEAVKIDNKLDIATYDEIIYILGRFFKLNFEEYFIVLVGGEPTLHPDFINIVKFINGIQKKINLYIVTNGYKKIEYFKKLFENVNNINLILKISIHIEYTNFEHIKDIIISSNQYNKTILLAFMIHPTLKKEREIFFNQLFLLRKHYNFNISFDELQDGILYNKVDSRYTSEDFEWIDEIKLKYNSEYNNQSNLYMHFPYYIIKDKYDEITIPLLDHSLAIRENKKSFKNMYCCYGINTISIWNNGLSSGAECNVFKRQNIYKDFFNWDEMIGYIKCPLEQCRCAFNDHLPRFRKEEDAKKFINEYKLKNNYIFLQDYITQIQNIIKVTDSKIDENIKTMYSKIEGNNIKLNKLIDSIAWWIPVRKWRDNFRNKFNTEQSRAEQSRAEQSRAEQSRANM
uniref:radical SAM protein n=1 Tax=Brachyspira catarrhinii TaxID=2528966 RepID=UPI003F4B6CB2